MPRLSLPFLLLSHSLALALAQHPQPPSLCLSRSRPHSLALEHHWRDLKKLVADATGISDLVREKGLHDGCDDELVCHVITEDMVEMCLQNRIAALDRGHLPGAGAGAGAGGAAYVASKTRVAAISNKDSNDV